MKNPIFLLEAEFRPRAERANDLFLLSAADAADFIRKGHRLGVRLAGVEGFRKTESGGFQPQQDFSNDAADTGMNEEKFVSSTLKLIENGGLQGLLFQVIFER